MKKFLSVLLCAVMVLSMIPVIGITASAADATTATEPALTKDADGAYLITSTADWTTLAKYTHTLANLTTTQKDSTNQRGYVCKGMTFKLTADLDFSGVTTPEENIVIGQYAKMSNVNYHHYFAGTFDGQGHTLSNITMSFNSRHAGLFVGTSGATIKNLNIKSSTFTSNGANLFAGAIVAAPVGMSAENGTGIETVIENCNIDSTVTVTGGRAGGIVGQPVNNDSYYDMCRVTIRNCYSAATVKDNEKGGTVALGGIIGMVSTGSRNITAVIENCTSVGTIVLTGAGSCVGGIVGAIGPHADSPATIKNCYSDIDITLNGTIAKSSYNGVGGIAGTLGAKDTGDVLIENCYVKANITGSVAAPVGIIAGHKASNEGNVVTVNTTNYISNENITNVIGSNGNVACTNGSVATTDVIPATLPSLAAGSLILDESKVGIRFYLSNIGEGAKVYLNNDTAVTALTDATIGSTAYKTVTDTVDIKNLDAKSTITVAIPVGTSEYRMHFAFSAADYIANQSTDAKAKAAAEALVTYGKYVSAYLNKNITDYKGYAAITANRTSDTQRLGANPDGLTFAGSSLVIGDSIVLRHYYELGEGKEISNYPLTVEGKALEWVHNEALDLYYVEFEVGAIDLSKQFELSLGDKVILACSVMDYCKEATENASNDMLKNVINALYNYRWAANDCFVTEA